MTSILPVAANLSVDMGPNAGWMPEQKLFDQLASSAQNTTVDFTATSQLANPSALISQSLSGLKTFVDRMHKVEKSIAPAVASGKPGVEPHHSVPLLSTGAEAAQPFEANDAAVDRAIEALSNLLGFGVEGTFLTSAVSQIGRAGNSLIKGQ
jgi:hypothetical protein